MKEGREGPEEEVKLVWVSNSIALLFNYKCVCQYVM